MITTHERRIIDREGKAIEVVLPIAEFEQLKAQAQVAEIIRRFVAGASLGDLSEEYDLGRIALSDLLSEHGLDANRYDVDEVERDETSLARFRREHPHGT
jgi:hypothetical protein